MALTLCPTLPQVWRFRIALPKMRCVCSMNRPMELGCWLVKIAAATFARSARVLRPTTAAFASRVAAVALTLAPPLAQATPAFDQVARNYASIVHASYADTIAVARQMRRAIEVFLAHPSFENLTAARQAWLVARYWYSQTEPYRFYGGPIDGPGGAEPRINGWPVDEAYIDSVRGRPDAGIINDPLVPIDARHLARLNARGGEENIATGWHAIEFLLWGQDFDPAGPGARSHEDFIDGKAINAARRRLYLRVVTDLLVKDLESVAREWEPHRLNYRARFERAGE